MGFLSQLSNFDPKSVGALQRVLLLNDGTLTDMVETIFDEPIELVKIATTPTNADARFSLLGLHVGELALDRRILLVGHKTKRTYVYGESVLAVQRLPKEFSRDLAEADIPIGRLWSKYKIEIRKDLVDICRTTAETLARHFRLDQNSHLLKRTYTVTSGGLPLMLISEYIPEDYIEDGYVKQILFKTVNTPLVT